MPRYAGGEFVAPTVQVEMFPAAYGDAFLVTLDTGQEQQHILIDGGFAGTYREHVRPRLIQLAQQGHALDLVVVTHVDADHIAGVISLFEENGPANEPAVIPIREVWHNSYRHLPLSGRAATIEEQERVTRQIAAHPVHVGDGQISARQGSTLAALLRRLGYNWNVSFDGGPVLGGGAEVAIGDVVFRLLSPTQPTLERLAYRWRRELVQLGVAHDAVEADAFEEAYERVLLGETDEAYGEVSAISASDWMQVPPDDDFAEDTSVTNASSIAFVLEFHGVRCMFLGDALPSVVETALAEAGAADANSLDLVKASHHGSARSTSPALLRQVSSARWLVSTNGDRHNHPDRDALLRIVGTQAGCDIYFNYPGSAANALAEAAVRERHGHQVIVGNGEDAMRIVLSASSAGG